MDFFRGALLANRTETDHRWLRVRLEGVKNLKLAPGAEIEVKAGSRYQKKIYEGTPLHFGLGTRAEIDTVRIQRADPERVQAIGRGVGLHRGRWGGVSAGDDLATVRSGRCPSRPAGGAEFW